MKKIDPSLLRMACGLFFILLLPTLGARAATDFQDAGQFPPLSVAHLFAGPSGEVAGITGDPSILFTWEEDRYHVVTVLDQPPEAITAVQGGFLVSQGAQLLHFDSDGVALARWHFQNPIRALAHQGKETVILTANGTLFTGNALDGEEGLWAEEALTQPNIAQAFFLFSENTLYLAANVDEEGIAFGLLHQRQATGDWRLFDFTIEEFDSYLGAYTRPAAALDHGIWVGLWDDEEHGPMLMDSTTGIFVPDPDERHYQKSGQLINLYLDQLGWRPVTGTRGDISFFRENGLLQRSGPRPHDPPVLHRANVRFDNYRLTAAARIGDELVMAFLSSDGLPYIARKPAATIITETSPALRDGLPALLGLPNNLIRFELDDQPFPEPVRIRPLGKRIAAIDGEGHLHLTFGRAPFARVRQNQLSKPGLKDILLVRERYVAIYPERIDIVPEDLTSGSFMNLERNAELYAPYTLFAYNDQNRVMANQDGRYYVGGHASISGSQSLGGSVGVVEAIAADNRFYLLGHVKQESSITPRIWEITGYGTSSRKEIPLPGSVRGSMRAGYFSPQNGFIAVGDRGLIATRKPDGNWNFLQILNEPNLSFVHVVDGTFVVGGPQEGIYFSSDGSKWQRMKNLPPHEWQYLVHSADGHFLIDAFGRRVAISSRYFNDASEAPVFPLQYPPTPLTRDERFYALCVEFEKIMAGIESWEELQARAKPVFGKIARLGSEMDYNHYLRLLGPLLDRYFAYGREHGNLYLATSLFLKSEDMRRWIQSLPQGDQDKIRAYATAVTERRVTTTPGDSSLTPKEAESVVRYDLDRVIERAYRGNKGAMIDLMYALNNSWGIAKDPSASSFWYRRAGPEFYFPENATPEQRAEVEQRMADAGSLYGSHAVLIRNRPPAADPAYEGWIQSILSLARRGHYGALDLTVGIWRLGGLPSFTPAEGRALLDLYLPANPESHQAERIYAMRDGLLGEPVNFYALRRLLEDYAPLERPKRFGESYFSSLLGDLLLAGLGGPADPERAALHHAYNERLLPGRVFSRPVLPALTDLYALQSRARAGDAIAKFDLAAAYRVGAGIPRNDGYGRRMEREAKEAGIPEYQPHINLRRQLEAGRELTARGSIAGRNLLADAAARLMEQADGDADELRPLVEAQAAAGTRTARRILAQWVATGFAGQVADQTTARRLLAGLALDGDPWARAIIAEGWRMPETVPHSTLAELAWEHRRNNRYQGIRSPVDSGIGVTFAPYLDLENRTAAAEDGDVGAMWDTAIVYNSMSFEAQRDKDDEGRLRYAEKAQDWWERYLLADGTETSDLGSLDAHLTYLDEERGSQVAPHRRARSLLRDEPTPESQTHAIELMKRAALRGNYAAALDLGKAHRQGQHGLTQDLEESKKWLELALPSDHASVFYEYAITLASINREDRAAFRPYFARALSKGNYTSAYDMVVFLPQLEAGGSIEAAAWLLAASDLEPELVAPPVAVERIHAAAVGGNRDAMSALARIFKQSLGLRAIDRAAAAGWGQLAKVDNGQPEPQLRWAESWLREGLTDEQWDEATNLTPERIAALKSAPLERIRIPWQQELERREGPARIFYNQIRSWTSIGRQAHRQLVESRYPLAFKQEVVDAAYERTDFPQGHPWFLRLLGDAEPVSDANEAEQRLQQALLDPRDTPEAQARFETALTATLFRLWFGVDRPTDRAAAAAWARIRSGGSRDEALTEAFYHNLTAEQRVAADSLCTRIAQQLPGGVPAWKPATLFDLVPELTVEPGKTVAGGE